MTTEFRRLDHLPDGALANMLAECYAPLLRELPEQSALDLRRGWREFDGDVRQMPDTVGRCGFTTFVDGQLVGFGSWDPRGGPEVARVGHNCVRPGYRRLGYGQRQIEQVLANFRARGFASAEARTGEHSFFEPARRMYERCGFRLVRREPGAPGPTLGAVVYRLSLTSRPAEASASLP
jgi:GNAT superfamily N-acetyltransferase